jgi:hypothetical protein
MNVRSERAFCFAVRMAHIVAACATLAAYGTYLAHLIIPPNFCLPIDNNTISRFWQLKTAYFRAILKYFSKTDKKIS